MNAYVVVHNQVAKSPLSGGQQPPSPAPLSGAFYGFDFIRR